MLARPLSPLLLLPRWGLYLTLALVVSTPVAAARKPAKPKPAAAPEVADGDPSAALKTIDRAALGLRARIEKKPKDEALRTEMAELAVRSAAGAERALSIGDGLLFDDYRRQFVERFHDTRWRLGRLAQQGNGGAAYAEGVLALHGYFEAADVPSACRHFESALAKRYMAAAFRAAQCIEKTDPKRAAMLLRESAGGGQPAAAEILGRQCLESKPADPACAWEQLTLAAAAGRPSAQSLLGWMYSEGAGGRAADPARAARLYEQSARSGDLSALNNLGELYETGRGVKRDPKQALTLYRKAADGGFAPAQFNLGRIYAAGGEVPRDTAAARKWLEAAEKNGISAARRVIDWMDQETTVK